MNLRAAAKSHPRSPTVTIIISLRERWRFTSLTVESILRHTRGNFGLWLLDSGLPRDVLKSLKPHVDAGDLKLVPVQHGRQPTYWRAKIAPQLTCTYAVFIDNDVIVAPGWLDALIDCAEETRAGIVCPLYLWGQQRQSDRIHMAGGKLDLVATDRGLRMTESHRHVNRTVAEVSGDLCRKPCGFGEYHCLLMRREVYSAEGVFDPGIATVHEHIHASLMAREMGFETWFEPKAQVNYLAFAPWHVGELSGFRSRWDLAVAERSLTCFAKRWNVIDDQNYRLPIRQFLTAHAGRSDVLDPRPNIGRRREQTIARTDLQSSFAGLQWLALNSGYERDDILVMRRAYRLAAILADGLYRPCGRPFINHLAGTASVLLFYGCPLPHVLAGLLHAAPTHGPRPHAAECLARFAKTGEQAKTATKFVMLYANRSTLPMPDHSDERARDQLPVDYVSQYILEAANEIDMHLSLEVAVSGRTDVLSEAKVHDYQTMLKHVGLGGMATTLSGLGKEFGEPSPVPFNSGQIKSFRFNTRATDGTVSLVRMRTSQKAARTRTR